MPPPLKGGGIKRCFCLTSVAHFGSRTEKLRKTKIGTEVAHVTRDSNCTFRVKGQGHQAALLTTVLRLRQLQQSAWERTDMFWSARWREALQRPLREERGGAYCVAMCTACYIILCYHSYRESQMYIKRRYLLSTDVVVTRGQMDMVT